MKKQAKQIENVVVKDTSGVRYDLLKTAMVERPSGLWSHGGGYLVLRRDLASALQDRKVSGSADVGYFYKNYKPSPAALFYTPIGRKRYFSIGCRMFDRDAAKVIIRWAGKPQN